MSSWPLHLENDPVSYLNEVLLNYILKGGSSEDLAYTISGRQKSIQINPIISLEHPQRKRGKNKLLLAVDKYYLYI